MDPPTCEKIMDKSVTAVTSTRIEALFSSTSLWCSSSDIASPSSQHALIGGVALPFSHCPNSDTENYFELNYNHNFKNPQHFKYISTYLCFSVNFVMVLIIHRCYKAPLFTIIINLSAIWIIQGTSFFFIGHYFNVDVFYFTFNSRILFGI